MIAIILQDDTKNKKSILLLLCHGTAIIHTFCDASH